MLSLVLLLALLPPGMAPPLPLPLGLAPQEEVDILVYGVLQFSQALHETYGATVRQVEGAGRRLRHCQHALEDLQHQAHRARQAVDELRGAVEGLKAEETALQRQTHGTAQALRTAQEGHLLLSQRAKELEETLASLGPLARATEPVALQEHAERQSLTLRYLVDVAHQQQQQMGRQTEQLARIWEQVKSHISTRT